MRGRGSSNSSTRFTDACTVDWNARSAAGLTTEPRVVVDEAFDRMIRGHVAARHFSQGHTVAAHRPRRNFSRYVFPGFTLEMSFPPSEVGLDAARLTRSEIVDPERRLAVRPGDAPLSHPHCRGHGG